MSPPVGVSRVAISLPSVVFPHPLSPTSASISPSWMLRFTSSTAFTWGGVRLKTDSSAPDLPALKYRFRPLVSTRGSAIQPTPYRVSVLDGLLGRGGGADAHDIGASGMEAASVRRVEHVG